MASSPDNKSLFGPIFTFIGGVVVGYLAKTIGPALQPQSNASSSSKKPSSGKRPAARPAALMQPREELRMVLCVNNSLKMGKGKIGAQCAHAAVGILQKYKNSSDHVFRLWERFGQPKITLKVQDEHEMAQLAHKAMQSGLPCYIVHDAGRTQIAAGSQTVLAIGPGYKSDVDKITGHLSLL